MQCSIEQCCAWVCLGTQEPDLWEIINQNWIRNRQIILLSFRTGLRTGRKYESVLEPKWDPVNCLTRLNSGIQLYNTVKLSAVTHIDQKSLTHLTQNTLKAVVIYPALKLCTLSVPHLPSPPILHQRPVTREPSAKHWHPACLHKSFNIRMSSLSIYCIEKRYVPQLSS